MSKAVTKEQVERFSRRAEEIELRNTDGSLSDAGLRDFMHLMVEEGLAKTDLDEKGEIRYQLSDGASALIEHRGFLTPVWIRFSMGPTQSQMSKWHVVHGEAQLLCGYVVDLTNRDALLADHQPNEDRCLVCEAELDKGAPS